jgi:hypothetical protein
MKGTWALGELFTDSEIDEAVILCGHHAQTHTSPISDLVSMVVAPALDRINKTTGQDNDARYLAYVLVSACNTLAQTREEN